MNTFHLTAHGNDWVLTLEGRPNPLGTYRSKDRALEIAIDLASEKAGRLQLHRGDGTLAEGRAKATGSGLRLLPAIPVAAPPAGEKPAPRPPASRRKKGGRGNRAPSSKRAA